MFKTTSRVFLLAGMLLLLTGNVAGAQASSDDVDQEFGDNFERVDRQESRTTDPDGTERRERLDVHVDLVTGVRRERERSRVRNPDGSETRIRTERFIDIATGEVLSEVTRMREDGADRADRADRAERAERAERADRADRADRPERADRADRADRAERAERADRADRSD